MERQLLCKSAVESVGDMLLSLPPGPHVGQLLPGLPFFRRFFHEYCIETFMQSTLIVCNIFRAYRQWRLYIFGDFFFSSYTLALTLGMIAVFL